METRQPKNVEAQVIINFGSGTYEAGFAAVTAQIWRGDGLAPSQVLGALPGLSYLMQTFQRWQQLYRLLHGHSWGGAGVRAGGDYWGAGLSAEGFEIEEDDITNVSSGEFYRLCEDLEQQLNAWLDAPGFRPIDQQLRKLLSPETPLRIIFTAPDQQLLRLPWCRWHFLEHYPRAEVALSPTSYERAVKAIAPIGQDIRILGVFGSQEGLDLETDQRLLTALPDVELEFLLEPSWDELNQCLWSKRWDIFFFAGHSFSETQGYIQLNSGEQITVTQLRFALKQAIAAGLQLAILNSCDSLDWAWELIQLNIPQVIAMGEPIADPVAQTFLKHFLTAFSQDQTLYCAVRQAREKLHPLEKVHAAASWLPVIVQNPAEPSPTWRSLARKTTDDASTALAESLAVERPVAPASISPTAPASTAQPDRPPAAEPLQLSKPSKPFSSLRLGLPILSAVAASIAIFIVSWLGGLISLEQWALDQLMRLRPNEGPDPRILVITINEADIQAQVLSEREVSLSDESLTTLLQFLSEAEAKVVGIDLYRDFPVSPQSPLLIAALRSQRVIGICKGRDPFVDPTGIAPPPEMAETQIGFSDFLSDADGVLRRQIVSMTPDPSASCRASNAFSSQIAFNYLVQEKVPVSYNAAGELMLGERLLPQLRSNSGGYRAIDAQGYQLMINYRALDSPEMIADSVSLQAVLDQQLSPEAVRDRIVLIGVTAPSNGDFWATPYGSGPFKEVSGVFIHAHMISQMLSAVFEDRPLIWTWSQPIEGLWLLGWAGLGSFCVIWVNGSLKALLLWSAVCGLGLTGLSLMLLLQGGWVPLIPAAIAFPLAATATLAGLQPAQPSARMMQ